MNEYNKRDKVKRIIAKMQGFNFVKSIPIGLWISNPGKVKEYLKTAEKQLK